MLTSNPALQRVMLVLGVVPSDGGSEFSSRVQLHHLKELKLGGDLRQVTRLLHQLDHPRNMDNLTLNLHNCDAVDVSQIIGPYLRGHLQRRDRPQNRLDLSVSSCPYGFHLPRITLRVRDAGGVDFSVPAQAFVDITIFLNWTPYGDTPERAVLDLITYIPQEEVVYLRFRSQVDEIPVTIGGTYTQFPNVRALSFDMVDGGDWSPLMAFLACRMSSGNPLDTLVIDSSPHKCPEEVKGIRDTVRELKIGHLDPRCPFGTCPGK